MAKTAQRADPQNGEERGRLYQLGCDISACVSDVAAHPYAQLALVVICIAWFALGLETALLTAALSILAITLTQMVLNRQNERELEAHRRDVAMHAKLDELIIAVRRAHNEMAGIEDLPEPVIVEMKEHALEAGNGETGDGETSEAEVSRPGTRRTRGAARAQREPPAGPGRSATR